MLLLKVKTAIFTTRNKDDINDKTVLHEYSKLHARISNLFCTFETVYNSVKNWQNMAELFLILSKTCGKIECQ